MGTMTEEGFVIGDTKVFIPEGKREMLKGKGYAGKELILGVRPEDIYTKASDIESNATGDFPGDDRSGGTDGGGNVFICLVKRIRLHCKNRF